MIQKTILWTMILVSLTVVLSAQTEEIDYKATFGIFGTVGTIKNKVLKENKIYQIETTVRLAGLAKMIMGGQVEHYLSKGHMENGLMVSDYYRMEQTKKHQKKLKEYTINHEKHYVTKRYRKWKKGKLLKDIQQRLKFYAKDDLLTLYFNMDTALNKKGEKYIFKAVGLEKQEGLVHITVPNAKEEAPYKKDLGVTADWYAKALIHQKNFRRKKGDILLSVDSDGFIKKAVIKDILMYGDAKLVRIK